MEMFHPIREKAPKASFGIVKGYLSMQETG